MPTFRRSAKDDAEQQPEGDALYRRGAQPEDGDDAEGHMFLPNDPATARSLAQGRSADIEREMRDRQRQKETRPNRR